MSSKPTSKCQCTPKRRFYCCSVCGAISFILTIFFALALVFNLTDELFFIIIKEQLKLTPDSSSLDEWESTDDVPFYKIYYLFDTQNPDAYLMGDVPIVEEVGPFAYRIHDTKLNLSWNDDETLLTYHREKYFLFAPEESIGDPHNYTITFLNVPLATVLSQLEEVQNMLINLFGPIVAEFYMSLIDSQELFIEKTAYELLWGYNDPLLEVLVLLGLTDNSLMKIELNTSDPEEFYRVNTGEKDIDSVDSFSYWKSISEIAGWSTEDARRIYGSESKRFPPRLEKKNTLTVTIFLELLHRHTQIIFSEEGTVHGINLYYYKNQHSLFSNASETPSNVAYNAFDFKYGMINLTAVMPAGMPIFVSKPHCLDCDPEYFKNVSGYHPNRKKHDSRVGLEPFTGFTMDGSLSGQGNFRILKNTMSKQLAHVRDVTMYPWYYYSLVCSITEEKADEFKNQINLPRLCLKITAIIFLCSLSITTLLVAGILCRSCYKEMRAKARTKSDYKCFDGNTEDEAIIKGSLNGSYRDYGSINGDVQDLKSSTGVSLSTLKNNYKDEDIQSDS